MTVQTKWEEVALKEEDKEMEENKPEKKQIEKLEWQKPIQS